MTSVVSGERKAVGVLTFHKSKKGIIHFQCKSKPAEDDDDRALSSLAAISTSNHTDNKSLTLMKGKYKGKRLIDIGCGPAIHSIISASHHFEEIILSDFADNSLEEINNWLCDKDGCFDWQPVIKHVCKMEKRCPSDAENNIKQKVKRVLKCDVRLENPFHPEKLELVDCVVTSLCLEAACKDLPSYKTALSSVAKLLRPGGVLVMVGVLGESFYCVNETRFSCLLLNKETIETSLQNAGFTVHEFNIMEGPDPDQDVSNYETVFVLEAHKPAK